MKTDGNRSNRNNRTQPSSSAIERKQKTSDQIVKLTIDQFNSTIIDNAKTEQAIVYQRDIYFLLFGGHYYTRGRSSRRLKLRKRNVEILFNATFTRFSAEPDRAVREWRLLLDKIWFHVMEMDWISTTVVCR